MPNTETLVYVLSGAFTFITILGGVIWNMLRNEAKDHAEQIKSKADAERLHELESRWQMELTSVKETSQKMFDKLEARHEKEMEQLSARLTDQIKTTETNILNQMKLLVETIKGT